MSCRVKPGCGRSSHLVELSQSPREAPANDPYFEPLSPARVWATVQPGSPGNDGRSIWHLVTMRYHKQVTMDTRIVLVHKTREIEGREVPRELFVKGFQNVDERDDELKLLCEEVIS
jgi:head-tail adaptor